MSAAERNFATFEWGDNVYELAGGVIPEVADRLDITLGSEPNSDDLQNIMSAVGTNKVLRQNEEITAIDRPTMVEIVSVSGIQQAISRSLLRPEVHVEYGSVDAILLMGGVANWQDRSAAAIPDGLQAGDGRVQTPVYTLAGTRVMDTPTEVKNDNVIALAEQTGNYPTEAKYMAEAIVPKLVKAGYEVIEPEAGQYQSNVGDELLDEFFKLNPALVDQRLAAVRVANAGILMALQVRAAARKVNPNFDSMPEWPNMFVVTDNLPLARTEEQEKDSRNYQKAATALRQLVLTAKKLHEATPE
jgi:hypothetical protein